MASGLAAPTNIFVFTKLHKVLEVLAKQCQLARVACSRLDTPHEGRPGTVVDLYQVAVRKMDAWLACPFVLVLAAAVGSVVSALFCLAGARCCFRSCGSVPTRERSELQPDAPATCFQYCARVHRRPGSAPRPGNANFAPARSLLWRFVRL